MPVYRRRNPNNSNRDLIKSWRVWIHWSEGDWTAETFKALNEQDRKKCNTAFERARKCGRGPSKRIPSASIASKICKS